MQSAYSAPKPLIKVKEKPLLWWATKSFHEAITSGLFTKDDIKIGILSQDESLFRDEESLKELFGDIDPFITIPTITSGPVETAVTILRHLLSKKQISTEEKIVVSDSDHFVRSISLCRNLEKESDIYLWEAGKDASLEWSFINWSADPLQLVEKPKSNQGLDISKGVIGIYGFGTAQLFLEAGETILKQESTNEQFMSSVVNQLLRNGSTASISEVTSFYPMGTPAQIDRNTNMPNPNLMLLDSPTYFVDLDGVLMEHNESVHGSSDWKPDKKIETNVNVINEHFRNAKIILVTARPRALEPKLREILFEMKILFDELIMGITGGVRLLVNDRKPRFPFLDTAQAINVVRNSKLEIDEVCPELEDISGGSGAKTVIIKSNPAQVLKYSHNEEQLQVLRYQADWYDYCNSNTQIETLRVKSRHEATEGYFGYTTDYRPNLTSFHKFKLGCESDSDWVGILAEGFHNLYTFKVKENEPKNNLISQIIDDKVFPSIEVQEMRFKNNQLLTRELGRLKESFIQLNGTSDKNRLAICGPLSLIHGDPTFENLQIDISRGVLVFVDPVGKLIEPQTEPKRAVTHFSFPVFDVARLDLSFRLNYESNMALSASQELNERECENLAIQSIQQQSILTTDISHEFSEFDLSSLPVVLATTVGRILKYKKNPSESLILAKQARKLIENIL